MISQYSEQIFSSISLTTRMLSLMYLLIKHKLFNQHTSSRNTTVNLTAPKTNKYITDSNQHNVH